MKTLGRITTTAGFVASVIFVIQAYNDSKSFSVFGADVAVSSADWTPLIISLAVFAIGLFVLFTSSKRS